MFVLIYSAFLGPVISILLVEYYILRKQRVNTADLYNEEGPYAGYNPAGLLAMFIGAAAAFIEVELGMDYWFSSSRNSLLPSIEICL